MSNLMYRQKMITALEAMQKSCSDMCDILKDEAGRNMELQQGTDPSPARNYECGDMPPDFQKGMPGGSYITRTDAPADYVDGLLHPKTCIDYGKSLHYTTDGNGGVIGVKDGDGNDVPMDGRVIGLMASCGLAPADERNTEFPQTARRMWKRWGYINELDGNAGYSFRESPVNKHNSPVTVLPGHSAVEEIEREAYLRGVRECEEKMQERIHSAYMEGKDAGRRCDILNQSRPFAIDGVSPVVVDGWTGATFDPDEKQWFAGQPNVWMTKGNRNTPCRIHMYVGIGPDGKRAGGRE